MEIKIKLVVKRMLLMEIKIMLMEIKIKLLRLIIKILVKFPNLQLLCLKVVNLSMCLKDFPDYHDYYYAFNYIIYFLHLKKL